MTPSTLQEFLQHTCAFCRRGLNDFDVTRFIAQATRKKRAKPQPGEVCCLRKDCKKARRAQMCEASVTTPDQVPETVATSAEHDNPADSVRESILFNVATPTRINEDGVEREESARFDVEILTSHEIEEWKSERGVKKCEIRKDREIVQDLLRGQVPEQRCARHGTPGCTPCRMLEDSLKRVVPGKVEKIAPAQTAEPSLPPLEDEVMMILMNRTQSEQRRFEEEEQKKYAPKYAARSSGKRLERTQKTRKVVKVSEPKILHSLRREHHYTVQTIATLLDDPRINAMVPERSASDQDYRRLRKEVLSGKRKGLPNTEQELLRQLSVPMVSVFHEDDVRLYSDYTSRNIPAPVIKQRCVAGFYGLRDPRDPDNDFETRITRIENEVIKRAWTLNLLAPLSFGTRSSDLERDLEESYDLEVLGIKKNGAGSIAGRVISGRYSTRPGRTFHPRSLNSFEHGGRLNFGGGDSGCDDGVDSDNYDEESAA
jgi:hypothetical protein